MGMCRMNVCGRRRFVPDERRPRCADERAERMAPMNAVRLLCCGCVNALNHVSAV